MKNLLPQSEQKRIVRMYVVRVATVALELLIVAGIIVCVALFPAYFTAHVRNQSLTFQIEQAKNQISAGGGNEARASLVATQKLVTLAHLFEQFPGPSTLIPLLRGENMVGITVTEMRITIESLKNAQAVVQGKAATRATLLAFSDAIERDPAVVEVTLPLRDLAANKDLTFTLTASLAFPSSHTARSQ